MNPEKNQLRELLCALQDHIRTALVQARDAGNAEQDMAAIAGVTTADTIYQIDTWSESAIVEWFEIHWPADQPVQVVMEGIEDDEILSFPRGTPVESTLWKCILDPIDGTRGIMYDKRSAWTLAALAPQRGVETNLQDIEIAAMSELPISKMTRADQISGVRGQGIVAHRIDLQRGERMPLKVAPSRATDFKHGFASFSRFFPEGKALMSQLEEELWDELYGLGSTVSPLIFDDQYICSGGQVFEVLVGHDRMVGDLRPLAYHTLGFDSVLVCHPYDICTAFLLQEAGGLVEAPDGSALNAPLNTTTPIAWMGYANEALANTVRPILARLMQKYFC